MAFIVVLVGCEIRVYGELELDDPFGRGDGRGDGWGGVRVRVRVRVRPWGREGGEERGRFGGSEGRVWRRLMGGRIGAWELRRV